MPSPIPGPRSFSRPTRSDRSILPTPLERRSEQVLLARLRTLPRLHGTPHRFVSHTGNHEFDLQGIAMQYRTFRQNQLLRIAGFIFQVNNLQILHGRHVKFADQIADVPEHAIEEYQAAKRTRQADGAAARLRVAGRNAATDEEHRSRPAPLLSPLLGYGRSAGVAATLLRLTLGARRPHARRPLISPSTLFGRVTVVLLTRARRRNWSASSMLLTNRRPSPAPSRSTRCHQTNAAAEAGRRNRGALL
jgi:hypothetical protein